MKKSCCVPGCKNRVRNRSSNSVSYHPLPEESYARKNWLAALRISHPTDKSPIFVCSRHFSSTDFFKLTGPAVGKLKKSAVPKIIDEPVVVSESNDEDEPGREKVNRCIKDVRVLISANEKQLAEGKLKPSIEESPKIEEVEFSHSSSTGNNFVVKSSLCSKADLKEIRKQPMAPSTVWRVIVPAPPPGQLNSENFIKNIVSKLPELTKTNHSASTQSASSPKSRKLFISEKLSSGNAPKLQSRKLTISCVAENGSSPEKRLRIGADGHSSKGSPQILNYCSLQDSTSNSTDDIIRPNNDQRTLSVDVDLGLESHLKDMYVKKIRTLQQIKRRMNSRIVELTKRIKTLEDTQCSSNGCKTIEHIIVIEAAPKCGCSKGNLQQEQATGAPAESLDSVLKAAVQQSVPTPSESRKQISEHEKLLRKIVSIKRGMKNKDLVRCVVIQAEDIS